MGDSWQIIKNYWIGRVYGEALLTLIDRVPQLTFPLGEDRYDALEASWGKETVYAPHNLWREVCHFVGGVLVGLAFYWIHPWVPIALAFSSMGYKLFFIDAKEGKPFLKALCDLAFWVGGTCMPLLWAHI